MAGKVGQNGKKVRQLDYFTDELIEEYPSLESAAEDNFITRKAIQYALARNEGRVNKILAKFEYA